MFRRKKGTEEEAKKESAHFTINKTETIRDDVSGGVTYTIIFRKGGYSSADYLHGLSHQHLQELADLLKEKLGKQ